MSSDSAFLCFSLLLLLLLQCSTMYMIFCTDGLEHDLIDQLDCISGLIVKDLVLQAVFWPTFRRTWHSFVFFISAPNAYCHLKFRYTDHHYLMEIIGVFNVLKSKTQYRMIKLGFDAILFPIVSLSLGYMDQSRLIDVTGVFSVLGSWKQYPMFKLGLYAMLFLAVAFANGLNGEAAEGSLESTGTSRRYYELIYFTDVNWHTHTEIVDVEQHIRLRDVQSIREIIAPFVIEGGHNVTIQFLGEEINIRNNRRRRRTRDLLELPAFQGTVIEFYAFPSYMRWLQNRRKYVAVDRSRLLDGRVLWVDMTVTRDLQELQNEVILYTGEIPEGSVL